MNILRSASWLLADRLLRASLGLAVGVALARSLGPAALGQYSYAAAIVFLLYGVVGLGLQGIVTRDIARNPADASRLISTALRLRFAAGSVAWLAIAGFGWLNGAGHEAALVAVLGATLVTQTAGVFDLWFQARGRAEDAAKAQLPAYLAEVVSMLVVATIGAGVMWVAIVRALGASAGALLVFRVYRAHASSPGLGRFDLGCARSLLRESWPVILSGFALMLYMRSDQVMLRHMASPEALGHYALAVGLAEGWSFLPFVVVTPLFPKLIAARKSPTEFHLTFVRMLGSLLGLGVLCALAVSLGAVLFLVPVYGAAYAPATALVAVYCWGQVFLCVREGVSRWLVIEGLLIHSLLSHACGALLNILLNLLLIPTCGALGAAIATVLSYAVASYAFFWFSPRTRPVARAWHDAARWLGDAPGMLLSWLSKARLSS